VRAPWALALLLLCGCSVAPPPPPDEDPALASLGRPLEDAWAAEHWNPPSMTVAALSLSYVRPQEALFSSVERPRVRSRIDPRSSWARPAVDPALLQRDLQRALRWGLMSWSDPQRDWPRALPSADPRRLAPLPGEDPQSLRARALREGICLAADDQGAQLVLHLELLENRVSFLRTGSMWWINLILFWQVGVLPVLFVPDEIYAVDLSARVTLLHSRSGRALYQREFQVHHEDNLNDPQRGWSLAGIVFRHHKHLEPAEGDLVPPFEALWPHAWRELQRQVLVNLRAELPRILNAAGTQELLQRGVPARARSHAIVVASSDPPAWTDRQRALPLRDRPKPSHTASADAKAIAGLLRPWVRDKHLSAVIDSKNARAEIRRAIEEAGRTTLALDQLIFYFAGFGTSLVREGKTELALVTDEGPLLLSELANWCLASLVRRPRVVFLLDVSFGAEQHDWGRSYRWSQNDPGGPPAAAADYLHVLGDEQLRWTVLGAAGRQEAAFEWADATRPGDRHGLFTYFLLRGLRPGATIEELHGLLRRSVPEWAQRIHGQEQTPRLWPPDAQAFRLLPAPRSSRLVD
jgi:hypothetical protein